jgi:hypothetical protein
MSLHVLLAWLGFGQAARSSAVLVCLEVRCGWLETGEDQAIRLPAPLSSRDIVGFPLQQRRSSKTTFASNDLVFTGCNLGDTYRLQNPALLYGPNQFLQTLIRVMPSRLSRIEIRRRGNFREGVLLAYRNR